MAIDLNKYKLSNNLDKYKLSNNLDKYKIQPEKQPPNYNVMAPAGPNAGVGESLIRGGANLISNISGKFGEGLQNVATEIMDYAGGAVTAIPAALDPSLSNVGKERVNPLTGNMVRPWFSANVDGTPQTPSQWAGEVLVHGAELAPWFMGVGEAGAATKATTAASGLSRGQKVLNLATKATPIATGFGTAGAVEEKGRQMMAGEAENKPAIVGKFLTNFILGLGADMALRGASQFKGFNVPSKQTLGGVDKNVVNAVNKVFKPTVKNVSTPKLRANYNKQAEVVFKTIDDLRPGFLDDTGNMVTDRNPETLYEFYQAFPEAKTALFNTYDDIARKSGEKGAVFNPGIIIEKLQKFGNDISNSKGLREYALKKADELGELAGASPAVIQSRIKELNSGLEGLYLGVDKPKLNVDASIANELRQELDTLIEKTTGVQYQPLKNIYGAFSTVEKDINRAVNNQLKKSKMGINGIIDIFTGGDITAGVLTANPGLVVKGMGGQAIKHWYNWFISPDRAIKKVFDGLQKSGSVKGAIKAKVEAAAAKFDAQVIADNIARKAAAGKQATIETAAGLQNVGQTAGPKLLDVGTTKGTSIPIPLGVKTTTAMDKIEMDRIQTMLQNNKTKRIQFVSPNVQESLTFEQATKNLDTPSYLQNQKAVESSYIQDGLIGNLKRGRGDWADGAEETYIKEITNDVSDELAIYSLAKNAKPLRQKDAIDFKFDPAGPDEIYRITPGSQSMENVRKILNDNGIIFKTLGEDQLFVVNSGQYFDKEMLDKMKNIAYTNNIDINKSNGIATFITGVDDREAAQKIYDKIINNYEKKYGVQGKSGNTIKKNPNSR